jgi:putative hydrolase of the HAD superfamily
VDLAAVLFDLDGTLLDHDAAAAASVRSWLSSYGMAERDVAAAIPQWFEISRPHYAAWQAGEISVEEQRRRRTSDFFGALGIPVLAADLDAAFAQYQAGYRAAWTAFDDAAPALRRVQARGLRVGVLTNGNRTQQTAKLTATGLIGLCGPVLASSDLPAAKPDRRAFAEACRLLGVCPGQVLMVGDDYENDFLSERAAGLFAIHLDRSAASPPAGRDRISTLGDLPL